MQRVPCKIVSRATLGTRAIGSPALTYTLSNLFGNDDDRCSMEEIEEGIKVGGKLVKDVHFADDQGMIVGSEGGL